MAEPDDTLGCLIETTSKNQLTPHTFLSLLWDHYARAVALATFTVPVVLWAARDVSERVKLETETAATDSWNVNFLGITPEFTALRAVYILIINTQAWVGMTAVYGWKQTVGLIFSMLLPTAVGTHLWVLFVYETAMQMYDYVALQLFVITTIGLVAGSIQLAGWSGDARLRVYLPVMYTGYTSLAVVYYYLVPSMFASAGSEISRVTIRIIAHPLMFEIIALFGRHVVRRLIHAAPNPAALWSFVFPIMVLNALFGRLLMFTMSSTAGSAITTVILVVLETLLRLTSADRDRFVFHVYTTLLGRKNVVHPHGFREHSNRATMLNTAFTSPHAVITGPSIIVSDTICEAASIITMAVVVGTFRLSLVRGGSSSASFDSLVTSFAIQFAMEIFTDAVCLAVELKRQGNAHVIAWKKRCKHHFVTLASIYVGGTMFFLLAQGVFLCVAQTPDSGFETFYC